MLGLLGTVYGLVYALGGLMKRINREQHVCQKDFSNMITTAWGLVVGVPALVGTWISFEQSHRNPSNM